MAAAMKTRSQALHCKVCKSIAKDGLKCQLCESVFHQSCAQSNNRINFIGNNSVTCCTNSEVKLDQKTDSEIECEFWDAISDQNLNATVKTMDVRIFNYLIKQKDLLISALYNEINMLREQICDRKKALPQKSTAEGEKISKAQKTRPTTSKIDNAANNQKVPLKQTIVAPIANTQNTVNKQHQAQETELLTARDSPRRIDANKESTTKPDASLDEKKWTTVTKKKSNKGKTQKQLVFGSKTTPGNSTLKVVPKKAYLYVTRLCLTTTEEALTAFLMKDFPEVTCEMLSNNYSSQYGRFKVTVNLQNLQQILHPDVWPAGVQVFRFFHPRRKQTESR